MKKRRILLTAFVCVVLCICMVSTWALAGSGLGNFAEDKKPVPAFSDVGEKDWFRDYVTKVAAKGLMVGSSATKFSPRKNVTLAETVTIASRLHSIYHTGAENFKQGKVWYQVYLDYATQNGIAYPAVKNYDRAATRAEFAQILAAAFPAEALKQINQLSDTAVPDVTMQMAGGEAIYRLYRAGVLTGNDAKGTFAPNSNIVRSEVATIVARMVDTSARVKLDLGGNTQGGTVAPAAPVQKHPTFRIQTVEAAAGQQQVAVTVSVENNPGISALALNLSYDESLVLKDVVYNPALSGETMRPQTMKNPIRLLWLSPFADVKEDFMLATLYFDVLVTAGQGNHQISATYAPDDVFDITEKNVAFDVAQGAIVVKK